MIDSPSSSAVSAAAGCLPLASHRPCRRAPRSRARTARSTRGGRRTSSTICARSESSCSRRTARACSEGMTLVTSAAVEDDRSRRGPRERARPAAPHPARIPRQAAQRRPAQRRRRRHQRQVDGDRNDRLDPPRLPSPADGDERRGDEEFRDARRRRSRARWSATPSCSSARSTKATARSRSTGPRSRC